jgi:hypothetical protein
MIINEKLWQELQEKNIDPCCKCCVDVARKTMELLDKSKLLRNGYYPDMRTAHGLICIAEKKIKAGGITGFMAGCVARMIYGCHSRGDEFWQSFNNKIKKYNNVTEKQKRAIENVWKSRGGCNCL